MNTENLIKANIFISGHRDLTREEFEIYYRYAIDEYINWINIETNLGKKQVTFYVGDCEGCDRFAIEYLIGKLNRNMN